MFEYIGKNCHSFTISNDYIVDEDELPKLLPPKRRRLIKDQGQSLPVQNGMERLIQEFPRHNWLENKYMQEDNKEGNVSIESNPAVSGARIISIETLSMLEESAPFTQSSNDATVLETNTIQHSAGIMNDTPQCQTNNDDDVVYGDDKSRHCSKNDSIEEMSAHSNDVNNATVDESLPISRAGSLYDDEYRNNHPEGTTSEQISKGVTEIVPDNAKNFMSTSESNDVSLLSTKQMDIESNTPTQMVEENQTEIRSVELDSDVGTVISISEKTENDQRITDMNQRENLPPIPRLIHATTLEAFGSLNDVSKSLSNYDENGLHDKDKCVAKGDQIENLPCEALQSDPNVSILIAQNAHLQQHSDESINAESNQSRDLLDIDNSSAFSTGAGSLEDKYVNEKKFQNETRVEVSKASIPHKHQVAKLSKLVDSNPSKWVITTLSNDCIVQEAAMNLNVQSKDASSCLPSVNTLQKADCLKQQASSYHDIPQPQLVEEYITRTTSMQINGNDVVQLNERHNHVTNKKTRQKEAEQKQFEEALRYEKLLQEYKTVEKMTELKEQERDRLLCLKDKMLKELNFMRTKTYKNDTPSSGAEINLKKTELHMQCPPPAHQPKKENVIEILEKMEQEASAIPADIRNSCPFRIRNTPLLNAPYDITIDPREKASLNQAVSAAHCANNKSNLFQMQGHFDTYNASKVCNNVSRSSSAPSQGCTKTLKTGVFSFQPPGQIPLGQGNAILISDKGKKRSSSEEIVNLRNIGEPERYMQFTGNERKIQEELKTAVAIKRQRMDAVNITTKHEMPANTFNNVDKVIPQNVSIAPQYRRIAPNNHNAATEFNQQKGNVNWQHLNLTKELLRKPNPIPTQHGFQRYPGQVQNGVRMSRGHLMHQVPRQQQLRPQTVRLLGATTMPQTQKHIQGHYQVQQPTISPYHVDHHKQDVNQSDQSSLMTASMDVRNSYNAFQAMPAVTYQKQNGVNRHTLKHWLTHQNDCSADKRNG
ncbi:hypothetical protein FSP39_023095 [Pinctada imbricata]|uniref:Uncharacterized protein n=1 Tax=Pinctada imbricata TaxID=66713 RepID=A0AA89BRS1_PINIB|nr:hypothetical protein FSP39_023095 [Pinctada imbricata]